MTEPVEDSGNPAPRLRLLGAADLDGAAPLRLLAERRYRLLAYLALDGGWVERDRLAALFWPDRTQEAARSNLRKLLLEARSLRLPAFEDSRQSLRWAVDHDVASFTRAHALGEHDAAIALYRGPLLPGLDGGDSVAFTTWLEAERSRLRAMWRNSVLAVLAGAPAQTAAGLCQRLLDDDPCDEDAVRAQMRAWAALGRAGDVARTYRAFAERVAETLGVEPAIATRRLARELQDERAARPAAIVPDSAPSSSEGFIGRGRELAELRTLLADPGCRLVTISGPGGMGKSRLAKEWIRGQVASAEAPVCWIALDDLVDLAQVAARLADELGLATAALQDVASLVAAHLAPLRALLVFDNAEHLSGLAGLIGTLLASSPALRVVVTSRSRVGIDGEWLLPLRGLDIATADGGDPAELSDAGRLFVAQASLAQPRFDAATAGPSLAALMRAIGGMPLAILLAASWVRLLPMADIVSDLGHLLDVLEQAEDGEERPEHRSIRATFEQSWRLLSSAERQLLMDLSVFAGGFTRATARAVTRAALPVLGSLLDKSLVEIDTDARCSLHPLIQQFSAEKLAEDPSRRDAAHERHAAHWARTMKAFGHFDAIDQAAALRTVAADLPEILAAWEWAIVARRADVLADCSAALSNFYQARGPVRTGADLFTRAEAALAGLPAFEGDWGIALELAALRYWLGDFAATEAAARRALVRARERANDFGIRSSLNTVGLALARLGRLEEAEGYLMEALERARRERQPTDVAAFAGNLVAIKRELGDEDGALALANEALAGHRINGHCQGELSMLNEIGLMEQSRGRTAEAIASFEQGLRLAEESGMALRRVQLLTHLAAVHLDAGALDEAEVLCRDSLRISIDGGVLPHQATCRRTLASIALARNDPEEARTQLLAALVTAGRIGTALTIAPLLRDCAEWLDRRGDPASALRCLASADAHRVSKARLLPRYRDHRERLRSGLAPEPRVAAEAEGAAATLQSAVAFASAALAGSRA